MAEKLNQELDELAFRLYVERAATAAVNRLDEQTAIDCYRKAEAFLAVRDRVRSGEAVTVKPTGPQLADASCPNLKKTHPYNLVSQRFGDLKRVRQINQWLESHPTADSYEELEWDGPTVRTARQIFPAYCGN